VDMDDVAEAEPGDVVVEGLVAADLLVDRDQALRARDLREERCAPAPIDAQLDDAPGFEPPDDLDVALQAPPRFGDEQLPRLGRSARGVGELLAAGGVRDHPEGGVANDEARAVHPVQHREPILSMALLSSRIPTRPTASP